MQSMESKDLSSIQSMIDEYQDLWKSIQKRLGEYRTALVNAAKDKPPSKKSKKKRDREQQQQQQKQQQQQQQAAAPVVEPTVEAPVQPTLVNESVQVSTLKFETDRAVQVDTLPPLMRLTSKEGYTMELDSALQECSENLDTLQTAIHSATPQIAEATIAANNLVRAAIIQFPMNNFYYIFAAFLNCGLKFTPKILKQYYLLETILNS